MGTAKGTDFRLHPTSGSTLTLAGPSLPCTLWTPSCLHAERKTTNLNFHMKSPGFLDGYQSVKLHDGANTPVVQDSWLWSQISEAHLLICWNEDPGPQRSVA